MIASLDDAYRRWPTRHDCLRHLETVRWGESPTCPYCGAAAISRHREAHRDDRWQCQRCKRSFSATVGTVFHGSHVDLQKWFFLISLMLSETTNPLPSGHTAGLVFPVTITGMIQAEYNGTFMATVTSAKRGLSAAQVARDLAMRRPTVWSMMRRIRDAMGSDGPLLRRLVEID